jgi:hypothetical protein
MGSFATSLHVKSTDANRVASTLAEILSGEGWRPTQKTPDKNAQWGTPSNLRAMQVSDSQGGWVSILDTDLMGAHSLAPAIAKKLATHAIFFFVNDSDSWGYLLANPKGAVSEYDSEDDADDDEDYGDGDMVEAGPASAQLNALMQDGSIMQKMKTIQERMSAAAPPEIREAETRIKSGRGTPADIQQYQAWAMQEAPKYAAELRSLMGGALDPFRVASRPAATTKAKRKPTKTERAAQKKRFDPLRSVLATGVTDDQVQQIFDQRAVFAEEILAEFLPLLGIADFYANLSYRYLTESTTDELASHNIRFTHHLRFETDKPTLHVFS